ncbi:sensor histidine kinase [Actinomadura chibensis]|uniref:sensor histidine kinase n=1 Tax=Actinomadura chibensis TaxID=392828 RepID=UPI00082C405C|nr:nitrate- and nitrite sensing domain-containing protein [Actinomadura chibensis]
MGLKITLSLVALSALWAFAAWVTISDGIGLYVAAQRDTQVGRPTKTLVNHLQDERRASQLELGRSAWARPGTRRVSPELAAQRARTDRFIREWRATTAKTGDEKIKGHVRQVAGYLDRLRTVRQQIDNGSISRTGAMQVYNQAIDECFEISAATAELDDKKVAADGRALIELTIARESLSRENALVTGILARGRFEAGDRDRLVTLAGVRQNDSATAARHLPSTDRSRYERLTGTDSYRMLQGLESRLIEQVRPGGRPAVTAEQWRQAAQPTLDQFDQVIDAGGDDLVARAKPGGTLVIVKLVLVAGLGLLALLAAVVVSITTARALVRQLRLLRDAARELADQRLPGVVERLGHGEKVDIAVEAPPLQFGTDEIGQLGQAFNAVQETALRTAVEQAELRRGIRDVLLSLARRTQTLVHRQLTMLDTMERRRDIEVKELEELFKLDHLATRMRRNAENLIVLSGALPARGWRDPVPLVDAIRGAVGEVEDYTRVTVLPLGPISLKGTAVGDVTHLLAELIENAVSFSPPETAVQVSGTMVASGFAIDIEDRGLGMTDEKLDELNTSLADPPDFNLQSTAQLGLFVVGRLAQRHNLKVMLKRSAYGGITAVVVIPRELIGEIAEPSAVPEKARQLVQVGADAGPAGAAPAVTTGGQTPPAHSKQPLALVAEHGDGDERERAAAVAAPPESAPEPEPEPDEALVTDSATPGGLPVRVPQASLAAPLKEDPPAPEAPQPDDDADALRSPEEVRRMVRSYQEATRRGRADAADKEPGGAEDPAGQRGTGARTSSDPGVEDGDGENG